MSPLLELVNWAATGVFAGSYLCREPQTLRRMQAFAAVLWIGYGVVIHSFPIIISNVIVSTLASLSVLRARRPNTTAMSQPEGRESLVGQSF
ncbi:MAG: hypothetical protein EXQ58_06565 [Acidobacteria bacterium]|nr:hypothetical protein [Acidobacteriota bacterium]